MNKNGPLQPHAHEPNPQPPSADPTITLVLADGAPEAASGRTHPIPLADLQQLPQTTITDCYIVSTGHPMSGPFVFSGVTLRDFAKAYVAGEWSQMEVVSADGFGNRVWANEAEEALLAWEIDGRALTRREGLVRLIVPAERDDALRQVKWVGEIRVRP